MNRLLRSLIPAAVLAIGLIGCGSDGGSSDASDGPGGDLIIEASEFAFSPETVEIAADTDVAVTLTNVGAVEHDWTIEELGVQIHADAGDLVTETVNVPAGTYEVICTVPGHADAGMVGSLVAD